MAGGRLRQALWLILLVGLVLASADEAPEEAADASAEEAPAEEAPADEASAAAAAAPAAPAPAEVVKKVKQLRPKHVGYGRQPSAYTETASYGAPHFLIMCILLVFIAAGFWEAYIRYGGGAHMDPKNKKKKKRHDAVGGYGAVNTAEEGDVEAPTLMGDLKGLVGGGAGAAGNGVGKVTGGVSKGFSIFTNAAKAMVSDATTVAGKAKSGISDAVDVSAHMEKVKQGASIVGNVAASAAADAKAGAEAGISKGLDTARSAADVSAHLEKAKAAASVVGNVASSAANDAAMASQTAAAASLSAAKDGAASVASPLTARSGTSDQANTKPGTKMKFDKSAAGGAEEGVV